MATSKSQTEVYHFDIDEAEELAKRESAKLEPFKVNLAGKTVTMTNPRDLDWKLLLEIQSNPILFFRHCMDDEDRRWLAEHDIRGSVLNQVIEAFKKHYKLDAGTQSLL